jgi:hypothetical protein
MEDRMFVNTGVRMTGTQRAKLDQLAQSLNTSRNRVFGMLLDAAEVKAPVARVELQKNSRNSGHNTVTADSVRNS